MTRNQNARLETEVKRRRRQHPNARVPMYFVVPQAMRAEERACVFKRSKPLGERGVVLEVLNADSELRVLLKVGDALR